MSHGFHSFPKLEDNADGAPPKGYRNLFGPMTTGRDPNQPTEAFRGYGLSDDASRAKTRSLLTNLANAMRGVSSADMVENPEIPSGYTYVAQLVAHDLTFVGSTAPVLGARLFDQPNLRATALDLDTIYGGGPLSQPAAYCRQSVEGRARHRLRIGLVMEQGRSNPPPAIEKAYPTDPRRQQMLSRDLARLAFPNLNDPQLDIENIKENPAMPAPPERHLAEVLIGDPRNDDHAILSQLVVLFHHLHNALCQRLAFPGIAGYDPHLPGIEYRLFQQARSITTLIYHNIIRQDLLTKLLSNRVYALYTSGSTGGSLDPTSDRLMPVEFSHAAFRACHAMARDNYKLTLNDQGFDLIKVLEHNSTHRPTDMPSTWDWLIFWPRFFAFEAGADPRFTNMSRLIGPEMPNSFYIAERFQGMSLPLRDLIRGASSNMRSVNSLCDNIARRAPELIGKAPGLWGDKTLRENKIKDWLTTRPPLPGVTLSAEDVATLANDPPLFFFILMEAKADQNGRCFGTVGSVIFAEVIFRALANAVDPAMANDAWKQGDTTEIVAERIFGSYERIPTTMAQMITWLAGEYNFDDPAVPPQPSPPFLSRPN